MKKMNKKGFTIVELVIVIAVIAILAAVMIPTFGGIIKKANLSSVQQEAAAAYKEAYALAIADGVIEEDGETHYAGNFAFTFSGSLEEYDVTVQAKEDYSKAENYKVEVVDGQVQVTEGSTPTYTTPQAPAEESTPAQS